MISESLPKAYQKKKWYDNYALFLIKKQEKNKKRKIKKIVLSKKDKIIEEKYSLMLERTQELRKSATEAEKKLRNKLLEVFGFNSFIFQKGFLFKKKNFFYIVDFFFTEQNLVLEVDGNYHNDIEQKQKDIKREFTLKEEKGIKILRFSNEQIFSNIDKIIQQIKEKIYIKKSVNKDKKAKCKFCSVVCKNEEKLLNHIKNSHKNKLDS